MEAGAGGHAGTVPLTQGATSLEGYFIMLVNDSQCFLLIENRDRTNSKSEKGWKSKASPYLDKIIVSLSLAHWVLIKREGRERRKQRGE